TPIRETHAARKGVQVRGVVQGVGFRPFIYRIATEEDLAGFIGNDTDGVNIEIEGLVPRIDSFLARLRIETPPLARIDSVTVHDLPCTGESGFRIVSSEVKGQVSTGIPADAATCADCIRELFYPADRRYRYPFLNCTNCGPRFTITRRIPYDRPQTSMAAFRMCSACQAEYDDPLNRRFHAQPNACPVCGPRVWLETPDGTSIPSDDPVAAAIQRLLDGEIAAIKGIGGFHLSVDATNEPAVQRLRARKHRFGKPLAVMVCDLAAARALCALTPQEEAALQTPARPIVLARARAANGIAASVAPDIPWLGIFLPYAPLQHLLLADPRLHALVMTSANLSEEPISIDNDEAYARLGGIADAFLMHDREILQRCDDSVVAIVDGTPQLIRRARGYVPLGVPLPLDALPLLAVGGHLKNVFTLARGRFAYQSQHLGDLENLTGLDFFRHSLDHLMRTFEIEPEIVAHDLHPGYLSTSWAKEWAGERNLPLISVQHHHAHIAACIAEHALTGPVIGLSLDGTGFGTDGTIWGGEVLVAHLDRFARFAHLAPVPMPGGDAAVREPWRMAFAHLRAAGVRLEESASLTGTGVQEARVLDRMIEKRVNAPLTSSLGRLFDAVAAIVLQRREVDYDAQAAIELEGLAVDEPDDLHGYSFACIEKGNGSSHPERSTVSGDRGTHPVGGSRGESVKQEGRASDPAPAEIFPASMWQELLADLHAGKPPGYIAACFHAGVTNAFIEAARRARTAAGIHQVVLSGGCLHNRRLARLLRAGLQQEGFAVFQHRNVSPGDGGLSYGQTVVAAAILANGAGSALAQSGGVKQ
ncbi:MAG: carbamoyltransferase HypF, partial [Terracidiphilus sp.]